MQCKNKILDIFDRCNSPPGWAVGLFSSLAFATTPALADDYARWGIGVLGLSQTEVYEDAGSETLAYPLIEFEYKQFEWDKTRFLYKAFESDGFELNPLISLEFDGYEEGDSDVLDGMGDKGPAIHAGFEYEIELGFLELGGDVRQDVSGESDGLIAEIALGLDAPVGDKWFFGAEVGVEYQSDKYADYYYGVDRGESLPGRPAYEVDSALNPFVELSAEYRINDSWTIGVQAEYLEFDSEISDSPIVGEDDQLEILIGVKYETFTQF